MNDIDREATLDKDSRFGKTSACSAACSATRCASRRATETFKLIERIRQTAIRFRRDGDHRARAELEQALNMLSPAVTVAVIRAFTYFSQLANIAEDLHQTGGGARTSSPAPRLWKAAWRSRWRARATAGLGAEAGRAEFFGDAMISPVLTAHPTEVQRKSILDWQLAIARLLTERDRIETDRPEERAANEEALRRVILSLVADAHPPRAAAHRARRDRERPVLLPLHVPARSCRACTPRWKIWCSAQWRQAKTCACPPFCAWGAGSAAIATATPT